MADAKLTALTAASALAGADLFYISQGGVSKKATHTQLLTLVGTTYVPLAGGTMTGALKIADGTKSAPSLSYNSEATVGLYYRTPGYLSFAVNNKAVVEVTETSLNISTIGFAAAESNDFSTAWISTYFGTEGAGFLRMRGVVGTNPQAFRIYGTADGSPGSNYQRMVLSANGTTGVTIAAEGLGTPGANQNITLTPGGTGKVRLPDGLATQLALCFTTTTNTGIFAAVSGTRFGIVSNGTFSLNVASNFISMPTASVLGWTSVGGADGSSIEAGLAYNAAGVVEVNNGTAASYRDLKLRNLLNTEYHQMTEMTAPSAPAANSVRIYAEDNGSGKTRLMALFASGVAQQLAIEP